MSIAPFMTGTARDLMEDVNGDTTQYPEFVANCCGALATLMDFVPDTPEHNLFFRVADGLQSLIYLMEDEPPKTGEMTPELYFDMRGFGHFKECYNFAPGIVIKFCAERNPTEEEQKVILDAKEAGFGDMFVPSYYIPLPRKVDAAALEKDDEDCDIYDEETGQWIENPEWHDNTILTHICFQPLVSGISTSMPERDCEFLAKPKYWAETLIDCQLPPNEFVGDWEGLHGTCRPWVTTLVEWRGVDYARRFAKFCYDFHIWDLHADNLGFTTWGDITMPIILDWMSR